MTQIAESCLVALAAAALFAAEPAQDTLIAHRGESVDAPENTLPAYRTAVERGFGFECDIYLSKDGRVFTFHDRNLKRTTGGANTNKCADVTWDEISRLDVGNWGKWKDSRFKGTRPALLEEVLALARDGRQIYIEVKTGPEIVPAVKKVFEGQTNATPGNVLFIAFNRETCKALKAQMPEYKVYLLTYATTYWGKDAPPITPKFLLDGLKETGADGVDCMYKPGIVTKELIKAVKDAGYEFHVWTVDNLADTLEAFRRGVQTVTTNCAKSQLDAYNAELRPVKFWQEHGKSEKYWSIWNDEVQAKIDADIERNRKAEVPFCALRFGYRFTQPDKWPKMRAALEKNRPAFDEVWFSTGVSFPSLAWHEEHARQCAKAADDLRKLGIIPSIELQTIIGHTDDILGSGDCSGQDWGTMVSADGLAAKHVSCPRDPKLIAYFVRVSELHAAWKPGSVWVDDDMSYRNRAPVLKPENRLAGCFCDTCIAGFSRAEGKTWERAALAQAIRSDAAMRKRWDDYSCAGMGELTRAIAAAVHRISPQTVMGYQYGGPLYPAIPRGLYDGSGHPVRLRPGAGAYWDTDPYDQLGKAYCLQTMLDGFRGETWIGACCPEIESCPRTFACRTAQGLILEAFENLALGMDFLSMFVADARTDEAPDFYADGLFPRLSEAHAFLQGYHAANGGTRPCGFSVPNGRPAKLVACRGVPIAGATGRSLGPLPDIASIRVRMAGSGEVDVHSPIYQTRVMQIVSSTGLTNFYARCDRAAGGKMPIVFESAVRAFAMPRVRDDWTLATVAIVNASIDRQDPVTVRLRGVPADAKAAVWHQPEAGDVEIALVRDGSDVRVRLPRIGAWACGYLSFR